MLLVDWIERSVRGVSSMLTAGCVAAAVLIGAGAVEAQVQTEQSSAQIYPWDRKSMGDGSRKIADGKTHVCVLAGLHGELDEWTALASSRFPTIPGGALGGYEGASWNLGGWGDDGTGYYDRDVGGAAVCVPFSEFLVDAGGSVEISRFGMGEVSTPQGFDCNSRVANVEMWPGYTSTFIAGFRGGFYGTNSRITVLPPESPSASTWVSVENDSCDVPQFEGVAYSLRVGIVDAPRFPFYYPLTNDVSNHWRRPIDVKDDHRMQELLAPTSRALCYFVDIGGDFLGNGEWAQIQPRMVDGVEWWEIDANAVDGQVVGQVQCLLYDQRTPPDPL